MAVSDSEFQRVKEKVEVLNGDRRTALDKRAFRYGEIRDLQEFIAKLRNGAEELGDRIEDIGVDTQALVATVARLVGDVNDLKEDTNQLRQRINKANSDITELAVRIGNARIDIDAIVSNTSTVQIELDEIQRNIKSLSLPNQQSSNVSDAPNANQYNRLVADVAAIISVLREFKRSF